MQSEHKWPGVEQLAWSRNERDQCGFVMVAHGFESYKSPFMIILILAYGRPFSRKKLNCDTSRILNMTEELYQCADWPWIRWCSFLVFLTSGAHQGRLALKHDKKKASY